MRALAVSLAVLVVACATAQPRESLPTPERFAADVRAGAIDPAAFDFARAGYWELDPAARLSWRDAVHRSLGVETGAAHRGCGVEDIRGYAALGWTQLASEAPDAVAWAADAAALRPAVDQLDAEIERAQREPPQDNPQLVGFHRAMQEARDPRTRELLRRVLVDQVARLRFRSGTSGRPAAQGRLALFGRMTEIDCDNTAWLRAQLAEINWFDIPTYGERADEAAWLIAQHADRTPEFQREVLARLEALPPGATSQRNVAYLRDRIAGGERRP